MMKSLMRGVSTVLLSAVTTGTSEVVAVPNALQRLTLFLKAVGTVSTGKVKFEGSNDPTYAGAWVLIGSEVTLTSDAILSVTSVAYYPFVRARVSTDLTGGAALTATIIGS
jgi:hypothetical protein